MCGIAGFIGFRNLDGKSVVTTAQAMGSAILHRGPDDGGIWQDDEAGVVLVHRRLSILDLSPAGHQVVMLLFLMVKYIIIKVFGNH
jgi:asparagine synthase (glutamine-hydrolysing)